MKAVKAVHPALLGTPILAILACWVLGVFPKKEKTAWSRVSPASITSSKALQDTIVLENPSERQEPGSPPKSARFRFESSISVEDSNAIEHRLYDWRKFLPDLELKERELQRVEISPRLKQNKPGITKIIYSKQKVYFAASTERFVSGQRFLIRWNVDRKTLAAKVEASTEIGGYYVYVQMSGIENSTELDNWLHQLADAGLGWRAAPTGIPNFTCNHDDPGLGLTGRLVFEFFDDSSQSEMTIELDGWPRTAELYRRHFLESRSDKGSPVYYRNWTRLGDEETEHMAMVGPIYGLQRIEAVILIGERCTMRISAPQSPVAIRRKTRSYQAKDPIDRIKHEKMVKQEYQRDLHEHVVNQARSAQLWLSQARG